MKKHSNAPGGESDHYLLDYAMGLHPQPPATTVHPDGEEEHHIHPTGEWVTHPDHTRRTSPSAQPRDVPAFPNLRPTDAPPVAVQGLAEGAERPYVPAYYNKSANASSSSAHERTVTALRLKHTNSARGRGTGFTDIPPRSDENLVALMDVDDVATVDEQGAKSVLSAALSSGAGTSLPPPVQRHAKDAATAKSGLNVSLRPRLGSSGTDAPELQLPTPSAFRARRRNPGEQPTLSLPEPPPLPSPPSTTDTATDGSPLRRTMQESASGLPPTQPASTHPSSEDLTSKRESAQRLFDSMGRQKFRAFVSSFYRRAL